MPTKSATLESRLIAILKEFEAEVEGVRGSAVADREGLPITNGFRDQFDLMAVTAMSRMATESSQKVFEYIGLRGFQAMILEGEDSKVLIYELGHGEASFIAVARGDVSMGLLKFQMSLAARRLEEELGFVPRTGPRIEEVFLLNNAGLLISHVARSPVLQKDRDITAAMLSAVQSFVKDSFGEKGGALEEMEMAHARVRLVPGRWTVWAIITTGSLSPRFLEDAKRILDAFEAENRNALDPWDGNPESLRGVDDLFKSLLGLRPA